MHCNTSVAMLFNLVLDTGQDTAIDCSVRPVILLLIHSENTVSHMADKMDITDRKET